MGFAVPTPDRPSINSRTTREAKRLSFLDSFRLPLVKQRHNPAHFIANSLGAHWFYDIPVHTHFKAFAAVIAKRVGGNRDDGKTMGI
jgi:hypothetical protein